MHSLIPILFVILATVASINDIKVCKLYRFEIQEKCKEIVADSVILDSDNLAYLDKEKIDKQISSFYSTNYTDYSLKLSYELEDKPTYCIVSSKIKVNAFYYDKKAYKFSIIKSEVNNEEF